MQDFDNENPINEPDYSVTYSARQKELRDKFVKEYLVDYNATAAAIRIGYPKSYAQEYAVKFMDEPYVHQQIKTVETSPEEIDSKEAMQKRITISLLREANYRGAGSSQSARVAALSKLSSIYGMDAPVKTQTEHLGPDGLPLNGVFVVPGLMTTEDWAKAAAAQQSALVDATTTPAEPAPPGIS